MYGPLVIGHRGASGHRPEHTAVAYRLAWRSGADSVEPDVVGTRDGVLVCRHDLELSRTTDVAERPELAHRRRVREIDGRRVSGWFVQDLDLAEVRTLRARERWPRRRPVSARFDDVGGILTLEELLDLRAAESARAGRPLGLHIELKHPRVFEALGMPLHEPLLDLLRTRGLTSALSPVSVMSFDEQVLRRLRREVDLELVRLVDRDQKVRRGSLARARAYASAVGLHQAHLPGRAVDAVRAAGLDLLVWTLRTDRDAPGRLEQLLDLGVDGLLCDQPEAVVEALRRRALEHTAAFRRLA